MPDNVQDQVLWAALLRPVIVVAALAVCATAGLAAWQRAAPLTAPTLFPFSETWYAKATAARTPVDGIADAQKAIDLAPMRPENWMLLAYEYSVADKAVSARVISAVRQSYIASPLDLDVSAYRLSFVLRSWKALPDDVRNQARNEAGQFGLTGQGQTFLRKILPGVPDERVRMEFGVITMVDHYRLDRVDQQYREVH